MRRGDFEAAWQVSDIVLAERRTRREDCSRWPRHLQFIWDGSDFDGRHVLVRCYHGLGDTLQYVRLLASLRQRALRDALGTATVTRRARARPWNRQAFASP